MRRLFLPVLPNPGTDPDLIPDFDSAAQPPPVVSQAGMTIVRRRSG